jgi:Rad3-related DNA helicase
MWEVHQVFLKMHSEIETVLQDTVMSETEREAFLERFQPDGGRKMVGFCVLGGIFFEGIDLKGDRLSGAVIVGVGLPQLCLERNIIMEYYKRKNGRGYEYAYMYSGMNKVLQAAGRVIRSGEDRGVVMLIDERFSKLDYKRLFPVHWRHGLELNDLSRLNGILQNFWDKMK